MAALATLFEDGVYLLEIDVRGGWLGRLALQRQSIRMSYE